MTESKASGFLPRSSDLRLRERRDQFKGTEDVNELLRDEKPGVDSKQASDLKSKAFFQTISRNSWFHVYGCVFLTIVSFALRFYKIDRSGIVVWDEAHFGKFGSYYIKHEFYHDVHPPLGKMLIGLGEYLAGFNGDFDFKSNVKYPDGVNFKFMRQYNAVFSSLCTPLTFYALKNLDFTMPTVYLLTSMVCLEHSFIVLGKFILLDSMLLFFTVLTFYCMIQMYRHRNEQFTLSWFTWLLATGVSIGCVCSVKWVGLFVTAVVGIYTLLELYSLHCDRSVSKIKYAFHWVVRIFTLIVIPIFLYMAFFKIHFALLYKTGTGDASTHTLFQANLEGNQIKPSPRDVAFGSQITLRSHGLSPNLLHSHSQVYPDGSNQKQVTGYGHRDNNNDWIIKYSRTSGKAEFPDDQYHKEPHFIKNGDTLRIFHKSTKSNLHSHNILSHVSKGNYEVSGYGNDVIGDEKDDWILEIVEQLPTGDNTLEDSDLIHPLTTSFRLKHKTLGCYLTATGLSYPGWGYNQAEIACKRSWSHLDKSTWWNIEDHVNPSLKIDESFKPPRSKFWTDFVVINFAMAASNNALVPDLDKFDRLASAPWEWPTLHRGLRMCNWDNSTVKYYLLGSPFSTWLSTAALPLCLFLLAIKAFRYQRQLEAVNDAEMWKIIATAVLPLISWILHYIPFLIMGRVTYVHHYVPALFFAIVTFGYTVDTVMLRFNYFLKIFAYSVLFSACIATYWYFSPFCQGMTKPNLEYLHLQILPSWDVTDAHFN